MQEIEKSEQFIKDILRDIPRRSVDISSKKAVWLRVQNSIRDSRVATVFEPQRLSFIFRYTKLTVSALSIALLAVLITATTVAAKTSLPGQALYPVKKVVERVEKTLATSDEKKVQVIKKHAQIRLTEVQALVATNQATDEVMTQTLADLETSTKELEIAATAASEKNPELVDEAIQLAGEREVALIAVGKKLEEGETKTAINEALNTSRKSVVVLKASKGEVEGATTAADEEATKEDGVDEATKTPPAKVAEPVIEEPTEVIESPVQIHNVIKGNEDKEESNEPKILPDVAN